MAAIIFDLDGTMADSFDYVADFLAQEAGQEPLSSRQKRELRGLSMIAMARQFKFGWWRLPGLFYRGRRTMRGAINDIHPFEGIPEVLEKLHAEGHELFVVSSNSVRNVHAFLHKHNLHTLFLELYGSIGMFNKAPTLRRLLAEHSLDIKDCVYIGDELRDIEAAQSVGMRMVAVSWGFARLSDLKAHKPTALVTTPHQLLEVAEEL